jgi:hypothetical protein
MYFSLVVNKVVVQYDKYSLLVKHLKLILQMWSHCSAETAKLLWNRTSYKILKIIEPPCFYIISIINSFPGFTSRVLASFPHFIKKMVILTCQTLHSPNNLSTDFLIFMKFHSNIPLDVTPSSHLPTLLPQIILVLWLCLFLGWKWNWYPFM